MATTLLMRLSLPGFLEVVSRADNTIKRIELKPYNTKDTYVMTYTNSTWSSWQLMNVPTFSDTGWLPLGVK